jgi:hypothetical protein
MTTETQQKPTSEMAAQELRDELEEAGVDYPKRATKAKLIELVNAARAEPKAQAEESAEAEAESPAEEVEAEVVDEEAVEDEVGKALALREEAMVPATAIPTPAEFNAIDAIAERIHKTGIVPTSYRGRRDDVFAALLFARELRMDFISALRDIYVIEGRTALAAHRQLAFLRRGGVQILESEATAERAYIKARRSDTGEIMAVEFTMEEASKIRRKGAALVDGDNWRNYPADMLWARCVGRLTRRLGSDLIAGGLPAYVADEVADFSGWGVSYGEGGVDVHRPAGGGRQEVRRDPEPNVPRSWPEIGEAAAPYGPELGWREWTLDAAERLFNTREWGALSVDQKKILGQKASGAIIALREAHDPGIFPPPTREEIQKAWASVLNGEILAGPTWRFSPAEAELGVPTYYEANGLPEPEPPAAASADASSASSAAPAEETIVDAEWTPTEEEMAEADAIPFGDDDPSEGYPG